LTFGKIVFGSRGGCPPLGTVVIKPAEYTSVTAIAFAEIAYEIGLPKGVLNVGSQLQAVCERHIKINPARRTRVLIP
jgi:Aldehyde dehydrogenase family